MAAIQQATGLQGVSTTVTTILVSSQTSEACRKPTEVTFTFLAYFVRNHASSPSNLPRHEEILPESPGLQVATPGVNADREAFYTPVGTPDLAKPATAFNFGTGQRTISAGAFRRNKSSLNQSIDGTPTAMTADSKREPMSIPDHQSPIDAVYAQDPPRAQHDPSAESEHAFESQTDNGNVGEIPPTYHESFTHTSSPGKTQDEEAETRDLR